MLELPSLGNLFGIFISIGKEHFIFHGLVNSTIKRVEFDVCFLAMDHDEMREAFLRSSEFFFPFVS